MTPFAAAFWEDEELGSRLFLDGIISVLDAETLAQQRHLFLNKGMQFALTGMMRS